MTEPRALSGELGRRLWARLLAPRDIAALVAFRIALGLLISVSAARFLAYGWIDRLFTEPRFHFSYLGFGWLPVLPAAAMHGLFIALVGLGLCIAAGLFYRAAVVLTFLAFTYVQLYDVANYLNHYYLVSLLLGLMCFIPAHCALSLDVWRRPALRSDTLPAWCTDLLRFQVTVVYVFAGLAKLNADWLLHAQPLNIWLSSLTDLPLIGGQLGQRWVAFVAAWAGFLFDTTVAFFLMWRRTRPYAYVAVLIFHSATAAMFPIGLFPVIMVTAALVFFAPEWPRRLLRVRPARRSAPPAVSARPGRLAWLALAMVSSYAVIQLAMPLRTHLYGGNVSWHEQGMRFSWRVMTREKNGSVTFVVTDPASGREWHVSPRRYLTRLQEREMAVQPDLILQLAHRIARDHRAQGLARVEVRVSAVVSLNGRPSARFIDPTVDLAAVSDGLSSQPWILPAPGSTPIHLRPLLNKRDDSRNNDLSIVGSGFSYTLNHHEPRHQLRRHVPPDAGPGHERAHEPVAARLAHPVATTRRARSGTGHPDSPGSQPAPGAIW